MTLVPNERPWSVDPDEPPDDMWPDEPEEEPYTYCGDGRDEAGCGEVIGLDEGGLCQHCTTVLMRRNKRAVA